MQLNILAKARDRNHMDGGLRSVFAFAQPKTLRFILIELKLRPIKNLYSCVIVLNLS